MGQIVPLDVDSNGKIICFCIVVFDLKEGHPLRTDSPRPHPPIPHPEEVCRGWFQKVKGDGLDQLSPAFLVVLDDATRPGKHTKNDGTSPFSMGKSPINGHFQ